MPPALEDKKVVVANKGDKVTNSMRTFPNNSEPGQKVNRRQSAKGVKDSVSIKTKEKSIKKGNTLKQNKETKKDKAQNTDNIK